MKGQGSLYFGLLVKLKNQLGNSDCKLTITDMRCLITATIALSNIHLRDLDT